MLPCLTPLNICTVWNLTQWFYCSELLHLFCFFLLVFILHFLHSLITFLVSRHLQYQKLCINKIWRKAKFFICRSTVFVGWLWFSYYFALFLCVFVSYSLYICVYFIIWPCFHRSCCTNAPCIWYTFAFPYLYVVNIWTKIYQSYTCNK